MAVSSDARCAPPKGTADDAILHWLRTDPKPKPKSITTVAAWHPAQDVWSFLGESDPISPEAAYCIGWRWSGICLETPLHSPHRSMSAEQSRRFSDALADVLCWFRGLTAAHAGREAAIDLPPGLYDLRDLKSFVDSD